MMWQYKDNLHHILLREYDFGGRIWFAAVKGLNSYSREHYKNNPSQVGVKRPWYGLEDGLITRYRGSFELYLRHPKYNSPDMEVE